MADYDWVYNDVGLISSMVSDDGTVDYTYDDTWQLLTADYTYTTDETYTYDANGNRNMTGYTLGDNNQITSDGTWDYVYDDEGNRTKKTNISSGQVIEYEYDYHNRLTKITTKASAQGAVTHEVEYVYDVFGHRLAKKIDSDGDSDIDQSFQYIYDGLRPESGFAGNHIVLVYEDADGDGAGTLALDARILHGPNVDQVLAHEDSTGDVLWALSDNLGSVRDIVNYASGTDTTAVDDHIVYGAFGNEISHTGTTEFLYGFTGRERDTESDLQYNRARYYDAAIGQWVSEDPIGFQAGDPNLRRYVGNSTISASDPSGELIIFVEGIETDKDNTNAQFFVQGMRDYWSENQGLSGMSATVPIDHLNQQGVIFYAFPAATPMDAWNDVTSNHNQAVGAALAQFIRLITRYKISHGAEEPIYIVAFSNGATIAHLALEAGIRVDGVILMGAALDGDTDLSTSIRNGTSIKSYYSPNDAPTRANGGGGYWTFNRSPGLTQVRVKQMHHGAGVGLNAHADVIKGAYPADGHTLPYVSYYFGYNYVGKDLNYIDKGPLDISTGGGQIELPNGDNFSFSPGYQEVDSPLSTRIE